MPESFKDEESNTATLILVITCMSLSKTWCIEVGANSAGITPKR